MDYLRFWNLFRPMEQRPPCRRLRRSEPMPMTVPRSKIEDGYWQVWNQKSSKLLLIVDLEQLLSFFHDLR